MDNRNDPSTATRSIPQFTRSNVFCSTLRSCESFCIARRVSRVCTRPKARWKIDRTSEDRIATRERSEGHQDESRNAKPSERIDFSQSVNCAFN